MNGQRWIEREFLHGEIGCGSCRRVYGQRARSRIETLTITVPDENTGDIMGIVNKRRGAVLGMTPAGDGMTAINAELPMAEIGDFATVIRQITRGMGFFTMEFARYEQLPANLEADVIANAPKYSEYEG